MSQRLVSVVLPVRNGANYLGAALDSVLAQSFSDFTLHVSDNASDDGTADMLSDYARRDRRVVVSRSVEPIGQVANMNRAVSLAQTPWVRMLCHDDLMRADCMAQTLAAVQAVDASPVVLIGNGEHHLYANGYLTPQTPDGPLQRYQGTEVLRRRFSGASDAVPLPAVTTVTLRKTALEAHGGFDPRWVHFDVFCWYKLLVSADYAFIPAQLTTNRIHGAQVAIAARGSLRSAEEHRAFVSEFIARNAAAIGLDWRARLRARLIAPGYAASAMVAELRGGQGWTQVMRLANRLPLVWLPMMPALTLRAWRRDARNFEALRRHVPVELLYPQ